MQKGFQNEVDFKMLMDGKIVKELPSNLQELLYIIFKDISPDSKVECWRSKYLEKADIKIRINDELRGISIKTGSNCSMHQENTNKFYTFLIKIGISDSLIQNFNNYIIGKVNNRKVNAKTYIESNHYDIELLNKEFNKIYTKTNLLIRFVFQGTELQKYGCDAIIYGNTQNFIWASKDEILEYLITYPITSNPYGISTSALIIKCYDRNLRNNPKRIKGENEIQVKWPTLERDLLYITKIRESNLIRNNK